MTDLADLGAFRCSNCSMTFRSLSLLDKHREKFCIGSDIGDPTVLKLRLGESWNEKGRRRDEWSWRERKRTTTPDFITLRQQRDRLARRDPQLPEAANEKLRGPQQDSHGHDVLASESRALRRLTDEFHRLRMSIQESMSTKPVQWEPQVELTHSLNREWELKEQVREMVDTHEQHLVEIQARNQELEQKRDEIRRRLSELASRDSAAAHIERVLLELRAQEERNQQALDDLRQQIEALQAEATTKADHVAPTSSHPSNPMERKDLHVSFNMMPTAIRDGTLSSEISALRLVYLQSGGNDPLILAQMHELQAEAQGLERSTQKAEYKEKKRRSQPHPRGIDSELLAVQMENERLEDELLRLHLQREKRKAKEESSGLDIQDLQREHMWQMASLQTEIEKLKQDMERTKSLKEKAAPPPPPPPPLPPPPALYPALPGVHKPADRMKPQTPLMGTHIMDPADTLGPAPYDPAAGFVVFYDFLTGLESTLRLVRLVVGLHSNGHEMSRPAPLPTVHCKMGSSLQFLTEGSPGSMALLSVKQPIPRVHPSPLISLVVELQAAGGFDTYGQEIQRLVSRGWTKFNIFDQHNQAISGFWKVPFRILPMRPSLSTGQLNSVPQVGHAELYLRIVNARDADMQTLASVDPANASAYKYPPMVTVRPPAVRAENPSVHHSSLHAQSNHYLSFHPHSDYSDPPPVESGAVHFRTNQSELTQQAEHPALGFIVDRVKDAPPGEGSLRLTGYDQRSGRVVFTKNSALEWTTLPVQSGIKQGYFIFGEQEMSFSDLEPHKDMILFVRFYYWPSESSATAAPQKATLSDCEEYVVAWGLLKLTQPAEPYMQLKDKMEVVWNCGTHSLLLYHVPVPPAISLNALQPDDHFLEAFEPYGNSTVRLHIFSGQRPEFPFPPESPINCSISEEWPSAAFIHRQRENPPAEPFVSGDGIDLYIDGARFLPDAVTISRVTGRIFDRNYNQFGPDISTGIDLNSNIFEPHYNERVELRHPALPPSSTLLLKVYTVDRFSLKLVLIGWAALNLFVESGCDKQPSVDSGGLQISLNEGAHQMRLYYNGPDPDKPLTVNSFTTTARIVPCASLLVRLFKTQLSRSKILQEDWGAVGLFQSRPDYSDGVYLSESIKPTKGEACLYSAMLNRSVVLVREMVYFLAGNRAGELKTDAAMLDWISQRLNRLIDSKPQSFNLSFISRYLTAYGVKVSVDRGKNLPWPAFTLALISFNPPAAFYQGASGVKYDRPVFVEKLDFNSDQSSPAWLDGFKSFPKRIHDRFLTVIVHLQAITVASQESTSSNDKPDKANTQQQQQRTKVLTTYTLGSQAWAAMPVFSQQYCNTGVFQLPLYQGSPSVEVLKVLSQGDCLTVLEDLKRKEQIHLLKGASVFIRISDGRREEELDPLRLKDIDQTALPDDQKDSYNMEQLGTSLSQLIPAGRPTPEFSQQLANKFKQLVYQTLRKKPETAADSARQL
ncbi:uncharacterized protein LOC120514622 isoform X1 [Polypterus senegalus]|uniref:uncharacterized protein LOC120514622 isoform X1 n=1 Tax=Polypterus senegalus TaxID=55291 RepID=UPI0019628202|nr:uncharacterized protein LOC120514622 isoform X1 [Polypterus senegalus]